jgi:hypothetical protein
MDYFLYISTGILGYMVNLGIPSEVLTSAREDATEFKKLFDEYNVLERIQNME